MAPHSSTLAWKIPWMEEPGRLQSMGSLRVRHDWTTSLSLFTFMHWRRKWQPTPVFLPGESQGWGSLVGSRHGVAQSRTPLKWLSSSSSSQSSGASASASVLPMNIQDWFPLGLTSLISLQSKGLSSLSNSNLKASILQHSVFFIVQLWRQLKGQWLPGAEGSTGVGAGGCIGRAQRIFRTVKLFCMILQWWIHYTFVQIHRLYNTKYFGWLCDNIGSSVVRDIPLWRRMLIKRGAMNV